MKKLIAFFHKCRPFDCLLEPQVDSMEHIMVFFLYLKTLQQIAQKIFFELLFNFAFSRRNISSLSEDCNLE